MPEQPPLPRSFLRFFLFFLFLFLATADTSAADPAPKNQEVPLSEYGGSHKDEATLKKLRQMTPEEIRELDRQLADALILYYDSEYARALPLFMAIAERVETSDLMFWIGMSAMRSGETDLAIGKFRQMLERSPELGRVRLELATAYFNNGRYDEARAELETVKAATPPAGVAANIDKLLAAIEKRTPQVFWNVRVSTGYMWDDNVAAGPEQKEYSVGGGGTLTPYEAIAKRDDEAWLAQVNGNVLVDIGGYRGWMWNSGLSFYHKDYFRYNEYNFQSADIYTGPWWQGKEGVFKMPLGFVQRHFGRSRLSYSFHVDPSYEHFFTPTFSLKGLYSISKEHFYDDDDRDLNNMHYRFRLTPSVYLGQRKHILSAFWGFDTHDAKIDRATYSGASWGFSYYTKFATDTELYLAWQKSHREYNDIVALYNEDRADDRSEITLVVSQSFLDHYFASIMATYLDNDSNLEIYGYDRTTLSTSVGCRF